MKVKNESCGKSTLILKQNTLPNISDKMFYL